MRILRGTLPARRFRPYGGAITLPEQGVTQHIPLGPETAGLFQQRLSPYQQRQYLDIGQLAGLPPEALVQDILEATPGYRRHPSRVMSYA